MSTLNIIYRKVAAIYINTMIKDGSIDRGGEHTVVKLKPRNSIHVECKYKHEVLTYIGFCTLSQLPGKVQR